MHIVLPIYDAGVGSCTHFDVVKNQAVGENQAVPEAGVVIYFISRPKAVVF
jgi:hypothetical protein